MREHGAFASACGATGVKNSGQIIGLAVDHFVLVALMQGALKQAACAIVVQRKNVLCARLERNLTDPAKVGTCTHHHRRFSVANEVLNFCTLVGGVERKKNIPCPQRGQVKHHGFDRLFHLHRNSTSFGNGQAVQ